MSRFAEFAASQVAGSAEAETRPEFLEQWRAEITVMRLGNDPPWISWSPACRAEWSRSVLAIINQETAGQPGRVISPEDLAWLETLVLEGAKVAA